MTIGAAFLCHDGIVIAADTKESYGDVVHTHVNKIEIVREFLPHTRRLNTEAACIALVGSGEAFLVDHIASHIKHIFSASAGADLNVFSAALHELLPQLYSSEAVTAYPHSDAASLYTQFLIAVRTNNRERAKLFQSSSSLVEEVKSGVCIIGCGMMQEMANEVAAMDLGIHDSATAALFLIAEAKRHYSYVGGVTHIFSMPHPDPRGGPPWTESTFDQGLKESLFAQLRIVHQQVVIMVASHASAEEYSAGLQRLQNALEAIRSEFKAIHERERKRFQKRRK